MKKIHFFLIGLSLVALSACQPIQPNPQTQQPKPDATTQVPMTQVPAEPTQPVQPPAPDNWVDTFIKDAEGNHYGETKVTGYAKIEQIDEPFCEANCKKYDYVYFVLTAEPKNVALKDFLSVNEGNSFAGKGVIGIGCKSGNNLTYWNDSDQFGMQDLTVTPPNSTKIFASTEQNPITIKINRLKYTSGRGAPACYSHFTEVKL